jgi:NitT/TauT family transport system substrate-binding protein
LVIDDTAYPEVGHSVITFDNGFLQRNPGTVRAFLTAVEQAVSAINADKGRWDQLLLDENLLPPPLLGTYTLPSYPTASVPSEAQFEDALQWAQEKGLITTEVSYQDSVSGAYLP